MRIRNDFKGGERNFRDDEKKNNVFFNKDNQRKKRRATTCHTLVDTPFAFRVVDFEWFNLFNWLLYSKKNLFNWMVLFFFMQIGFKSEEIIEESISIEQQFLALINHVLWISSNSIFIPNSVSKNALPKTSIIPLSSFFAKSL